MNDTGSRILVIYSWDRLWSMGPGKGSPDFYLSLKALAGGFSKVVLVYPAGNNPLQDELPQGVEGFSFRWPGRNLAIKAPGSLRDRKEWHVLTLRAVLFSVNWLLRIISSLSFTMSAFLAGQAAASKSRPQMVAAYGYLAVPAARLIALRRGVRLVVRLFGVSLGMKGFSAWARIAQFEETLSFKLKADRWVITNDGSGGEEAARRLGVPASKIVHLLCGVQKASPGENYDPEEYRRSLGLPAEAKILLRVARLWPQQHIERMLCQMPARLPGGVPVAAVIVGVGPEREYLEKLAASLGVRAIFTGALKNSDLGRHYECADLYVATSDRTNLTNSVLEALCHGLPVVALDTGHTGSLIQDGVNGMLVGFEKNRNLDNLGKKILDLLSDEPLRHKLSQGALRTADELIPGLEERMRQEVKAFSYKSLSQNARKEK